MKTAPDIFKAKYKERSGKECDPAILEHMNYCIEAMEEYAQQYKKAMESYNPTFSNSPEQGKPHPFNNLKGVHIAEMAKSVVNQLPGKTDSEVFAIFHDEIRKLFEAISPVPANKEEQKGEALPSRSGRFEEKLVNEIRSLRKQAKAFGKGTDEYTAAIGLKNGLQLALGLYDEYLKSTTAEETRE